MIVGISVAMVCIGAVGLIVVTRKLRAHAAAHVLPERVSPLLQAARANAHVEDENTDIVLTGVPYEDAGPNTAEPETTRHGPFQRLRAWEVEAPAEGGLNSTVRTIQVEDGPIVQLRTTDE